MCVTTQATAAPPAETTQKQGSGRAASSVQPASSISWLGLKKDIDIRALGILSAKFLSVAAHWMAFDYLGRWGWALTPLGFVPAFLTCCITHNAMHCDMFKFPVPENIFRSVLSLALGHPVQLYRPTHNHNHHVHTQTPEDHIHTQQVDYPYHWMNFFFYFFHIIPSVANLEGKYIREQVSKRSPALYKIIMQAIVLYGAWATLLFRTGDVERFFACVYIPGYLGIYGILTINMLQHDGCAISEARTGKNMDVSSARNFVDPSLNYWTLNNGYHSIHHMYPNMHWSEYAAKHEELVKPYIDPILDQPSILGYLWTTYIYPGRMPEYRREKAS